MPTCTVSFRVDEDKQKEYASTLDATLNEMTTPLTWEASKMLSLILQPRFSEEPLKSERKWLRGCHVINGMMKAAKDCVKI